MDLHLQTSNPAEGQGIPLTDAATGATVTVTDDFDGQARSTLTRVDVGADAGSFSLSSDVFAPVVSYRCSPAAPRQPGAHRLGKHQGHRRRLRRRERPAPLLQEEYRCRCIRCGERRHRQRLEIRHGTDAGGGSYSFTMDYSLISGGSVVIGDTVQYFVVAQDDANNLGSSPIAAAGSANPPVQNLSAKPLAL